MRRNNTEQAICCAKTFVRYSKLAYVDTAKIGVESCIYRAALALILLLWLVKEMSSVRFFHEEIDAMIDNDFQKLS